MIYFFQQYYLWLLFLSEQRYFNAMPAQVRRYDKYSILTSCVSYGTIRKESALGLQASPKYSYF